MLIIHIDQRPTSELLQARNCLAQLQGCADALADEAYESGWVITIDMLLRSPRRAGRGDQDPGSVSRKRLTCRHHVGRAVEVAMMSPCYA
jgi:hypothetical protein